MKASPRLQQDWTKPVSNHCFSARVIGRLSKTWAWAVISILRRPNNPSRKIVMVFLLRQYSVLRKTFALALTATGHRAPHIKPLKIIAASAKREKRAALTGPAFQVWL